MTKLKTEIEKILPKESNHYYVDQLLQLFKDTVERIIGENDKQSIGLRYDGDFVCLNCIDKILVDEICSCTIRNDLRKQIEKEGMQSLRLGMLDFLSHGKRILNTRWFSVWIIKK